MYIRRRRRFLSNVY